MTQTMSVKIENDGKKLKGGCESIHSGQFMVSHFEAEAEEGKSFKISTLIM